MLYVSRMDRDTSKRWSKTWPLEGAVNAPYGWLIVNAHERRTPEPKRGYTFQAHFASGWGMEATACLDPNGKPVATSFSLFPLDEDAFLPVNSNLLKEIPIGELLSEVRSSVAEFEDVENQYHAFQSRDRFWDLISPTQWPGRGVQASEKTYAALAFCYLDALRSGETKPVEALAVAMDCKRSTASNRLADTRAKGFLSSAGSGSSGGKLTEKAQRLLDFTVIEQPGEGDN